MNTYDLAYQILANGFLPTAHPDYPLDPATTIPYQLYRELNDCMTQNFSRMVVNARSGYWLTSTTFNTVAGQASYRLPIRMATGGLERIELARSSSSDFEPLQMESGTEAAYWERSARGTPERFDTRGGDALVLMPPPDSSSYVVKVWYYLIPSRMVTPQSKGTHDGDIVVGAPGFSPTLRGSITSVNKTTRVLSCNGVPNNMLSSAAGAQISVGDRVDVVKSTGWHEPVVVDAEVTAINSGAITIGGTQSLDNISTYVDGRQPDFLRAAGQTDWPMIPRDFHRTLADVATINVLTQLHLLEKAAAYAEKVSADLERFRELLQPRVKNQAGGLIPMMMPSMHARGPVFRGGFP